MRKRVPKARILDGAPVAKMRPGAAKRAKTGPRRSQKGAKRGQEGQDTPKMEPK